MHFIGSKVNDKRIYLLVSFNPDTNKIEGVFKSFEKLKEIKTPSEEVQRYFSLASVEAIKLDDNIKGLAEHYHITEKSAIDFMSGIKDGSIALKDGQTMLQGYETYLQTTTKATAMADLKTKALTVSMKVLSSIGWMLAISVIVKGIELAATAFDKWIHKVETAANEAQQSSEAWKSVQAEIDSLNTELETTATRIDELNAKDSLTIIEQEELERLKEKYPIKVISI